MKDAPIIEASSARAADAVPGRRRLSTLDAVFLTVGMVVGVGIFKAPSVVAAGTSSAAEFLAAWLLGGTVSIAGSLVYAELCGRHPETGGEYTFLGHAYGRFTAFVFAWSRMTVMQTGAIVAVAFVFGDYASRIVNLGAQGPAIYAALSIGLLTALNLAGTLPSKRLQTAMEIALIATLVAIALAAIVLADRTGVPPAATPAPAGAFAVAMVFVLLTYGGWNEVSYLAGEVRDAHRRMVHVLLVANAAVIALYLLVNAGYLATLGLSGMRESAAVGADLMRVVAGDGGSLLLSIVVCVSALTTMNAAIITGARSNYALGQDHHVLAVLGRWREGGNVPVAGLAVQTMISLALVALGSVAPDGFNAMVAFTAPAFWFFLLLTAASLFVLRWRRGLPAGFRTPGYPLVPLAFCAACAFMLHSSLVYARSALEFSLPAMIGVVLILIGVPLAAVGVPARAGRRAPGRWSPENSGKPQ